MQHKKAQEFINALHAGGGWGFYWTLPDKKTHWFESGQPADIPQDDHVYFGVHPSNKNGGQNQRSKADSIRAINCLYADFDAKDKDKSELLTDIALLSAPPSILIDSGGGYHAYWLLESTYPLNTSGQRERADKIQKQWVSYVGADDGAKDLARVLRVPGTLNRKYDPARPVEFVEGFVDLDKRYSLDFLERISEPQESKAAPVQVSHDDIPQDDRAGEYWLKRAGDMAHVGTRNETGFWLACQLRDNLLETGIISTADAESIMRSYAQRVTTSSEPYTEAEALASLKSALSKSGREPAKRSHKHGSAVKLDAAPDVDPEELFEKAQELDNPVKRAPVIKEIAQAVANESPTIRSAWADRLYAAGLINKSAFRDEIKAIRQGQADLIPDQHELQNRYLSNHPHTLKTVNYRRYKSGWWPIVEDGQIEKEVKRIVEAAQCEGVDVTAYLINQVQILVSMEVWTSADTWDKDTGILVCKNGTLNVDTYELREHRFDDYATGAVPYDYDPGADCPSLKKIMEPWGDDITSYLQEYAGYALTTDTSLETAIWLKGEPGGGKSTFLEGLKAMLGEKCGVLGISTIERSRFGLTSLIGKTLLVASDQPGGYVTASNILNNIISGEPVKVERKFEDSVDVIPTAKIAWSMNDLPKIEGGGNNGLFRRVKVIEIPKVPKDKRDPALKELVKQEGPGILNWALQGLRRLRERGRFDAPQCVLDTTTQFKERNDKPALFLAAETVEGNDYKVKSSELYQRYKFWCDQNGYRAEARQNLADDWKRLGLIRKKLPAGIFYFGRKLRREGH
jgi:putative DNA primase/helicase